MLMNYFVCSEIGVVNFLHRHFDWSASSLWYEELPHEKDPSRLMFVLGGKDFIVNSDVSGFSYFLFFSFLADGNRTTLFYSVLSDTLNLTASRRVYYIPLNTPTARHSSTVPTSSTRSWTGSRNHSVYINCLRLLQNSPFCLGPSLHLTFIFVFSLGALHLQSSLINTFPVNDPCCEYPNEL